MRNMIPTNNDLKYYNHLLNSFIMPNHAAIIRRSIKTFFPNIDDNDLSLVYVRCKFNPRFLIKNFNVRETCNFWYKVILIIPKFKVLKGIEHIDADFPKSLTLLHYLGEEGKINFEVHSKDVNKSSESIELSEEYIKRTINIKSNSFEKTLSIKEINESTERLVELNNFLNYLKVDVINELIIQWKMDLDIYLLAEIQ